MKKHTFILFFLSIIMIGLITCTKKEELNEVNNNSLPVVITGDVSAISSNAVYFVKNISVSDNSVITARGICYDTIPNPSLENLFTSDGEGNGEFTSKLDYLSEATTYYAKAYATNSEGTSYGDEVEFSTSEFSMGDPIYVNDIITMIQNSTSPIRITENKSMFGLVTMDEQSGNLYKTVIFEDITGGIMLEFLSTTKLMVGDSIQVNLYGAMLYSYYGLPIIDSLEITNNVLKLSAGNAHSPLDVSIPDLRTLNYTGRVVRLNEIQFNSFELGKTFAQPYITENRYLEDCEDHSIIVRTSGYANFANELLPEGNGSIIAFASCFMDIPQLIIRSYNEVIMDGERCGDNPGGEPIDPVDMVNEEFNDAEDYTDIAIEGWTNILVAGDRSWVGKTFNAEKYAQATGYNSGIEDMETWLITPPVTNISDKVLSFKSAMGFWAHSSTAPMTVLISSDFVGNNFETATWTELDVIMANENDDDHEWINSGEVDLSNYNGNAAIAFKYKGSDVESTAYRLDDIKIDVPGSGGGGEIEPVDEVNETFDGAEDYSDIDIEGWTTINLQGNRNWQGKTFGSEKYAQATAYNSGLDAMETWLITPPITNIGTKKLNLKTAKAYWAHTTNNPFTVLVSENFNGENFETASWTEINPVIASESDNDNTWIESGDYDLSDFNGNAAIAFRYLGSLTESTSYRLDDIVVNTEGSGGGGNGTVDMVDEQFNSAVNYEDISLEAWVNVNIEGDRMWQGKQYSTEKYAQSTAYNSGLDYMECWLITPIISDIGSKSLSLKTAMAYWTHSTEPLIIMVSTDYDGENHVTATWTEIDITTTSSSDNENEWIDSGIVSLSAFSGDAAIAFKYVGSNTESTSIRIDDILVQ